MLRILFLITGLNYAGAENQVVQLCKGFKDKGCQIALVSMIQPVAYLEELEELGVDVQTLHMNKGIPDPRAIFRLRRIISRFEPDVVHSHMVHANILARVTRLFVKMPLLVCTAHNRNEGGQLRELLYRLTDPLCEITTNVSQDAVDHYRNKRIVPQHKIKFIPNGIDVSRFKEKSGQSAIRQELGISEDLFIWFAAGRMVPEKDYRNMLYAYSLVTQHNPNSILLIAGSGPEREEIEQLCRTLHLEQQVQFLGVRKDIPDLMGLANAYLMSSKWEGMPIVLLEAAASGLPIVATDVGGNREVVRNGISGLLAAPENSEHLSEQMLAMMAYSPQQLMEMGEQGRQYVEEYYNMEVILEQWLTVYNRNDHKLGVEL